MKLTFPKLTKEIDLAGYHPDMQVKLYVWVNPPVNTLTSLSEKFKNYADSDGKERDDLFVLFSEFLSQGPEDTHFSHEEIKELVDGTADTDPVFWVWLQGQIFNAISDHRTQVKKK